MQTPITQWQRAIFLSYLLHTVSQETTSALLYSFLFKDLKNLFPEQKTEHIQLLALNILEPWPCYFDASDEELNWASSPEKHLLFLLLRLGKEHPELKRYIKPVSKGAL